MIRLHCRYCQRQPQHTDSEWCSKTETVLTAEGEAFCANLLSLFESARARKDYRKSDELRAKMERYGVTPDGLWHPFFCSDLVFRDLFTEKRHRKHVYITHHNCEEAK